MKKLKKKLTYHIWHDNPYDLQYYAIKITGLDWGQNLCNCMAKMLPRK